MKCTCGKDGWLRMMMTCELAQEDSAGTGTENSPWKQHWTMQKVWVLVLNGLMPGIPYCCDMIYHKNGRTRIRNAVSLSVQLGFNTRGTPTRWRFPEDFRSLNKDSPKTDFKYYVPLYANTFLFMTPGQKWHHRYTDYYNYQYINYYTSRSLIGFLLIPQRVVSESPTVCTWCMPAWNQWRSRLSFLIGMTHLTSSEYRKRFVHLI